MRRAWKWVGLVVVVACAGCGAKLKVSPAPVPTPVAVTLSPPTANRSVDGKIMQFNLPRDGMRGSVVLADGTVLLFDRCEAVKSFKLGGPVRIGLADVGSEVSLVFVTDLGAVQAQGAPTSGKP